MAKQKRITPIFALFLSGALFVSSMACAENKNTPPPDLGTMTGLEAQSFYLGLNAVMWGYPAVFFEQLQRARTQPDIVAKGQPQAAVNQLGLVRELRGPEYKQIATPNNDTLYSQAFVDVSQEPIILSVPDMDPKRYYTFQIWDPNGDTFAYIGSREKQFKAAHYAFVGPHWKGTLPDNVQRIDSEYNGLVVWGRLGVTGPEDLEAAKAIQAQFRLERLSQFDGSNTVKPVDLAYSNKRVALDNPQQVPDDLMFYVELANSLKYTPPKARDVVVADSLKYIGFKDLGAQKDVVFDYNALTEPERVGLAKAVKYGLYLMDVNALTAGINVNGWRYTNRTGIMGTDYLFRATVAKWFTGANAPQEAIYMDNRTDDKGNKFDGNSRYLIHFNKGELPPAKAFWSISMYDGRDGSFVANAIHRYTIGDRTPNIQINKDGSLDIYLQNEAPSDPVQKANWLPTPTGNFYLNLRIYNPDDSLQNGTWRPPVVKKL